MQQRIEKLINFIDEYAEDYLSDGTKERIIKELKAGDTGLAIDIVKVMDKEWVDRVKEMKKFCLFTDTIQKDFYGETVKNPYYKANYMDLSSAGLMHVPTLRKVQPRDIDKIVSRLFLTMNKDFNPNSDVDVDSNSDVER